MNKNNKGILYNIVLLFCIQNIKTLLKSHQNIIILFFIQQKNYYYAKICIVTFDIMHSRRMKITFLILNLGYKYICMLRKIEYRSWNSPILLPSYVIINGRKLITRFPLQISCHKLALVYYRCVYVISSGMWIKYPSCERRWIWSRGKKVIIRIMYHNTTH